MYMDNGLWKVFYDNGYFSPAVPKGQAIVMLLKDKGHALFMLGNDYRVRYPAEVKRVFAKILFHLFWIMTVVGILFRWPGAVVVMFPISCIFCLFKIIRESALLDNEKERAEGKLNAIERNRVRR